MNGHSHLIGNDVQHLHLHLGNDLAVRIGLHHQRAQHFSVRAAKRNRQMLRRRNISLVRALQNFPLCLLSINDDAVAATDHLVNQFFYR